MMSRARTATSRRNFFKQLGSAAVAALPISARMASAQPDSASPSGWTAAVIESQTSLLAEAHPSPVPHERAMRISHTYLNIPIARSIASRIFQISVNGVVKREFPLQLADGAIDYWIFIYVDEFKGQTLTLSGPATESALNRIYQADQIADAGSLYEERNRPQFHFTVRRGWSNDVNGPIFYKGQYHLFWQAYPFGVTWNTAYMDWGHAVGSDLIHWRELAPALVPDKLGSPWSGTALVDHRNDGGWGQDALVLVYTAFDHISNKEVQCIAYSTDDGASFTRYAGNPVVDSNHEVGTTQTRDPKVFWHGATGGWVMVLFEKDGVSFYTSTNLKAWTRKSHFKGPIECPDFFELPVDGDETRKKWILHGGSSSYFIGSFDGNTFTSESPELRYAEGENSNGDDLLYAAQSFAEMPNGRRVQMAWGRIAEEGMPFSQMMLFPTEFSLRSTRQGLRLLAAPIEEIDMLHAKQYRWTSLTATDVNRNLLPIGQGPLHVKAHVTLVKDDALTIRYQGSSLAVFQPEDIEDRRGAVKLEILIDRCVAEIFVDGGRHYMIREIPAMTNPRGLEFDLERTASTFNSLEVYEMKSIWR